MWTEQLSNSFRFVTNGFKKYCKWIGLKSMSDRQEIGGRKNKNRISIW